MKLEILNINHLKNENIFDNISIIIYSLIPIFLIIGTALSELAIFILSFKFLIDIIILKKIKLFQNNLIYYLLIIYAALLINLIFSVNIDNSLLRPRDIKYMSGDSSKAKAKLNWKPTITFKKLIQEMINFEISNL